MAASVALPDGRYEADLEKVTVVPVPRNHRYFLVLECVTDDAVHLTARQPLGPSGGDDPFALTDGQRPAFRAFARRLGLDGTAREPAKVVKAVEAMAGRRVLVKVRHNRHTGRADCRVMLPEAVEAAGELSLMTLTQAARVAHTAHEALVAGMGMESQGVVAQARACFELRECDGWIKLGHDGIASYLAQPEISMGRSTFYDRAAVWEDWVLTGGADPRRIAAVGWSRLRLLARAVRDGLVDADEALADAAALGMGDLVGRYRALYDEAAGVSTVVDSGADEGDGPVDLAQRRRSGGLSAAARDVLDAGGQVLRALERRADGDELELVAAALRRGLAALHDALDGADGVAA